MNVEREAFPSLSGKTSIRTNAERSRTVTSNILVSIPFREDLHSDDNVAKSQKAKKPAEFPSLSGKTSIRTETRTLRLHAFEPLVSIPFREDLHSDAMNQPQKKSRLRQSFHPFQGRPPFGREKSTYPRVTRKGSVSIPFREDLHSDSHRSKPTGTHQPSQFPSLSGKTSIRTKEKIETVLTNLKFPSLSGKTSIRTGERHEKGPFSEFFGFHPFQGRPPFGRDVLQSCAKANFRVFPSLSGKTSIRTRRKQPQGERVHNRGFHPFQGRPPFGPSRTVANIKYL